MTVLIIPGYGGSGPGHWQTLWERQHPDFVRVEQRDWFHPVCEEWVSELGQAIDTAGSDTVLVAHSLGCHTVAHWAYRSESQARTGIRGALLVAPPDLEAPGGPEGVSGFTPVPMQALPFRSILVASNNDPHAEIEVLKHFAMAWGSDFREVGACGHINAESGLDEWPQGLSMLQELSG